MLKCETLQPRPPRASAEPRSALVLTSEIVIWKYSVIAAVAAPTTSIQKPIGATWFTVGTSPTAAATATPHTTGHNVCGPLRTNRATSRLAKIEPTARRLSSMPEVPSAWPNCASSSG